MNRIISEWQPTSGYTLSNSGYETGVIKGDVLDIEVYQKDRTVEIWIAVE